MFAQASPNALRRPGIYFQEKPQPTRLELPPLDVAAFVGFAQRGPVDTPVAVEEIDTYRAIFGDDLAIARKVNGEIRYASLPAAVTGFFANGGRRCYVVRVVGPNATHSRFYLPGLLALAAPGDGTIAAERVTIEAASPGRWSATLTLATQLRVTPLATSVRLDEPGYLTWDHSDATPSLETGELLRLIFTATQPDYLVTVTPVTQDQDNALVADEPALSQRFQITQQRRCFRTAAALGATLGAASPPPVLTTENGIIDETPLFDQIQVEAVAHLTAQGQTRLPYMGTLFAGPRGERVGGERVGGEEAGTARVDDEGFALLLVPINPADGPPALRDGDLLQLTVTAATSPVIRLTLLLAIEGIDTGAIVGSPPAQGTLVYAGSLLEREPAPALPAASPPALLTQVERLRFDLLVQEGEQARQTGRQGRTIIADLGFDATHPRFWGNLILLESSRLLQAPSNAERATQAAIRYRAMQQSTRDPQIEEGAPDVVALAGQLAPLSVAAQSYLPLSMGPFFAVEQAAAPGGAPLLETKGDDDLATTYGSTLFVDSALVPNPAVQSRTATTLAQQATDRYAIQQQRLRGLHSLFPLEEVALVAVPDAVHVTWTAAPVLAPEEETPPAEPPPPDRSQFHACTADAAPEEEEDSSPEMTGTTPTDGNRSEEANLPILAAGEDPARLLNFAGVYATLLEIHHALINLGQARRDWVAILTLPEHFGLRHCQAWMTALRGRLGLPARTAAYRGPGNLADLSYAAVYHPWFFTTATVSGRDGALRTVPADGVVCGVIATRAIERGVWVAPANVPLQNVLGLQPRISDAEWTELFALGFNLIRAEPLDFRIMSAHTLSDEGEWLQLSVRRLLILLRKVALDRGMAYVFENNDEQLRNAVTLAFGRVLQSLFERGALAGATPQQAFRLVLDDRVLDNRVNRATDRDNGRFFIDIQVAPAQPLEFITVRLLRTTDGDLQLVEL